MCVTINCFPNVYTCLHVLLVMPVSTAAAERSHSSLKIVKSKLLSRIGEGRLNALMLLYVHKDIELDYNKIIDRYTKKYPCHMRFSNPLQDKWRHSWTFLHRTQFLKTFSRTFLLSIWNMHWKLHFLLSYYSRYIRWNYNIPVFSSLKIVKSKL